MDVATFRSTFPEFGPSPGVGVFSDTRIMFWLTLGSLMMDATKWAGLFDHGLALFIAHHLAIDNTNQSAVDSRGRLGQVQGPVASKAVDKVSVAYDTGAVTLERAGHWNLTTYGIQYYKLLMMFGAGGYQL